MNRTTDASNQRSTIQIHGTFGSNCRFSQQEAEPRVTFQGSAASGCCVWGVQLVAACGTREAQEAAAAASVQHRRKPDANLSSILRRRLPRRPFSLLGMPPAPPDGGLPAAAQTPSSPSRHLSNRYSNNLEGSGRGTSLIFPWRSSNTHKDSHHEEYEQQQQLLLQLRQWRRPVVTDREP